MTSALLSNLSEAITSLFQSFRLQFVLPAFIFWMLNALFVLPVLPEWNCVGKLCSQDSENVLLIMLALAFLLGYFLTIINIWLIRLFEGYHWKETQLAQQLIEGKLKDKQSIETPLKRIKELSRIKDSYEVGDVRRSQVYEELKHLKLWVEQDCLQKLHENFPKSEVNVLPTSLGNAIAAFEDYPKTRYGIDAVVLWPRLLPTLTKHKYAPFIEREKAGLDFFINLCFLLLIFSIELFCVGQMFGENAIDWSIASCMTILVAYGFYKMARLGVSGWGMSVRVAFDLYRYDLLAAIYGCAPKNLIHERQLWENFSEFYKRGGQGVFDYKKIDVFVRQSGLPPSEEAVCAKTLLGQEQEPVTQTSEDEKKNEQQI